MKCFVFFRYLSCDQNIKKDTNGKGKKDKRFFHNAGII